MQIFVVVNNLKDWPLEIPEIEVIEAKTYLMDPSYSKIRHARIFNLCRSYRYQTIGYYVTLIATARGHKPQPSLVAMQDFKSSAMIRFVSQELDELIQKSLKSIHSNRFTLSIYFGKNVAQKYERLSSHLFKEFQAPFLQAQFHREAQKWCLTSIGTIAGSEIPIEHHDFVLEKARDFFLGRKTITPKKSSKTYDLAILYNPAEKYGPSNEKAIQKFIKAADSLGMCAEIIHKEDFGRLAEFDALLIRETTNVNHHTYRFARRAAAEGLVVVDDPESILRCSNKVYMTELLERYSISAPKTIVVHKDNLEEALASLPFPFVIKQPDSAFSQGVVKVSNKEEFYQVCSSLMEKSDLLVAQEFLPTEFDWRVAIFDGQPLYVCKYFMARNHWQIYNHSCKGGAATGKYETIPVSQAPKQVIKTALKAAKLIGDGLYGVDLKQIEKECYVIEVNDNPSIDAGIEDLVLQEELYHKIISIIFHRIEKQKRRL
ncbi:RimK family protein [Parachlamydia sp. AcF125]|uniref:RimK family protein n=1 Tax=Parachlamydia sp. AcF125 TaxID=2795736 RepID=UPI001BC9DA96|nr:RimK family protein [Parachlamydia sp. AcF125]MBS4169027.1 Alpha-aminoadipate--LysW ligase LysX [Parachlamydia sp. AcF125]